MATEILHTFSETDPRARIDWQGWAMRAVCIRWDDEHGLSVDMIRVTATGRDFKRANSWLWLTLEHSLERFPGPLGEGKLFADYCRDLVKASTEPAPLRAAESTILDAARYFRRSTPAIVKILREALTEVYTPLGDRCGVIRSIRSNTVGTVDLGDGQQWHGRLDNLIVSRESIDVCRRYA